MAGVSSGKRNHPPSVLRGTAAQRLAHDTTHTLSLTQWAETDTGNIYMWDGSAWVALGGGATHNLFSATHPDTNAAAVVRGDVIVGDATPEWSRLPKGAAAELLRMNAGGTDPEWGEASLASLADYVRGSIIRGGVADWEAHAAKTLYSILLGDGTDIVSTATSTGNDAHAVLRTSALKGIRPAKIGLGASAPDQDGAIALLETTDPTNAANIGMLYVKDKAGITVAYLRRDGGDVMEIAHVIDGVTKTVKASGGDFTTIQAAINWYKGALLRGSSIIDIDPGAYDEAVSFPEILIAPGSTLTLQGDTRALVGLTFVDGANINGEGIANGGSGVGGLSNAGNVITVTGAGGNPSYSAAGIVNGDEVLVYDNTGTTTEYTVDSTLNNTITLTVAAPNVGNDGTAICLLPNRRIERTTAGSCISVSGCQGVCLDGIVLISSTGASCNGMNVSRQGIVYIENLVTRVEDIGIISDQYYSSFFASSGYAISFWGGSYGLRASFGAQAMVLRACFIGCTIGSYASYFSLVYVGYTVAANCGTSHKGDFFCFVHCTGAWSRQHTTGYYARYGSYLFCQTTNANCTIPGAAANYSPLPALPGSAQGNHFATLYAS